MATLDVSQLSPFVSITSDRLAASYKGGGLHAADVGIIQATDEVLHSRETMTGSVGAEGRGGGGDSVPPSMPRS